MAEKIQKNAGMPTHRANGVALLHKSGSLKERGPCRAMILLNPETRGQDFGAAEFLHARLATAD